jgi:hypothetical protein
MGNTTVGQDRREPLSQGQAFTKDLHGTGWGWRHHTLSIAGGQVRDPAFWLRGVVHRDVTAKDVVRRSGDTSRRPEVSSRFTAGFT